MEEGYYGHIKTKTTQDEDGCLVIIKDTCLKTKAREEETRL